MGNVVSGHSDFVHETEYPVSLLSPYSLVCLLCQCSECKVTCSPATTDDASYKSTQAPLILVSSCPARMCFLARNSLVKYEVKFLGLITQKCGKGFCSRAGRAWERGYHFPCSSKILLICIQVSVL